MQSEGSERGGGDDDEGEHRNDTKIAETTLSPYIMEKEKL